MTTNNYIEIERKFLLSKLPEIPREKFSKKCIPYYEYRQGYLPGTVIKERVSLQYLENTKYRRAVKIGSGIERYEFNETITEEIFNLIWPLTLGRRLHKERWCLDEGELIWEVDNYLDRSLSIAEVELPNSDYKFSIPDWLQPFIVKEVTEDPNYEGFYMGI